MNNNEIEITPGEKPCVLVVNDEYALRLNLSLLLEIRGCETDLAADGAVALKKVKANRYDLMLTDLNMPRMNGVELVRAVRKAGIKFPILIMTAGALRIQGNVAHFNLPSHSMCIDKRLIDGFYGLFSFDVEVVSEIVLRLLKTERSESLSILSQKMAEVDQTELLRRERISKPSQQLPEKRLALWIREGDHYRYE